MRQVWVAPIGVTFSRIVVGQENRPKPNQGNEPLAPEQIAVYRAVLRDYIKGSDRSLNLADRTDALDLSDATND